MLLLLPPSAVHWVSLQRKWEKISRKQLWTGEESRSRLKLWSRNCFVSVVPTASPLVLKALKEGPRDRKKTKGVKHNGNIKLDDVIEIAKKVRAKSYAREFKGTVKEVLGTCVSVGCTVDGKKPKEV